MSTHSDQIDFTERLKARREEWRGEQAKIVAAMRKGTDDDGWRLSPEAVDNLRLDLHECNLALQDINERLATAGVRA